MDKKKILLINDLTGYGEVAAHSMLPILSYMDNITYTLPTALVSNTLDYGKFSLLDTTDFMANSLRVWEELGFSFDAIATGLLVSKKQAKLVTKFCQEQAAKGVRIFVDPVMGDEGKFYNGVEPKAVEYMRELVKTADLICPNYTEACLLTGTPYSEESMNTPEAHILVSKLLQLGTKSALITSAKVNGQTCILGFNNDTVKFFIHNYKEIPVHFPGTGDIFSAILFGYLMKGFALEDSTEKAANILWKMIDHNKDNEDKNAGIPVERSFVIIK